MKRITLLLSLLITVFQASVFGQKNKNKKEGTFLLQNQFKDYIPISPIEYEQDVIIYDSSLTTKFDTLSVKELSGNKKKILTFLPNEAVYVTVQKIDASGNISYGPASITASSGNYTVIMDYCKFTTLKALNGQNSCAGFTKVGVGLRITANIQTLEAGLNTGSLFGLGLAAQLGKLKGTMSIDVIGMESSQITDLIPLPSEISPTSIQNALQALAAIKTKIYDLQTRLFPQIVAIKKSEGDCSVFDILKNMDKEIEKQQQQQQQQQKQQQQQQIQQQIQQRTQ